MNGELKETFSGLWEEYFDGAEFPIASYYTDKGDEVEVVKPPFGNQCVMAVLSKVQKGTSPCFEANSIGCPGEKGPLPIARTLCPISNILYEIRVFDASIHYSSQRRFRPEVILAIKIMHREGFDHPTDSCEVRVLNEMEENLKNLGPAKEIGAVSNR